jgi:hypothetical protein
MENASTSNPQERLQRRDDDDLGDGRGRGEIAVAGLNTQATDPELDKTAFDDELNSAQLIKLKLRSSGRPWKMTKPGHLASYTGLPYARLFVRTRKVVSLMTSLTRLIFAEGSALGDISCV